MSCIVHKFGGTSVGDAAAIKRTAQILINTAEPCLAVVSACAGITDALVRVVQLARSGHFEAADRAIETIAKRHTDIALELLGSERSTFLLFLDQACSELRQCLLRWQDKPWEEACVLGFGEYFSSQLLFSHLMQLKANCELLDARQLICGDGHHLELNPCANRSKPSVKSRLSNQLLPGTIHITQGFIASHFDGKTAVLGRGGSDFSAGFLASLLGAKTLYIWTDTAGVLTADPRKVSQALSLESINYEEAKILAQLGAKVLHPRSVEHPQMTKIPVWVKSSFSPEVKGTVIDDRNVNETKVLSITSKADVVAVQATWLDHHHVNPFEGCRYESSLMSLNHEGFSAVVPQDKWVGFQAFANKNQLELEVEEGLALLSVVGHRLHERHVTIAETLQCLQQQNIESKIAFISPKGTHFCILLPLIKLDDALKALHGHFFVEQEVLQIG